jgi:hypothetical protein
MASLASHQNGYAMRQTGSSRADGHGVGIDVDRTLGNAGVIGLWEYRIDEELVYSDAAMAVFYGVDPELARSGVPPCQFRRAIYAADLDAAVAALKFAISSGSDYVVRYRVLQRNGTLRLIEVRGRPKIKKGRTVSVTGVNTDVTEQVDRMASPLHQLGHVCVEAVSLAKALNDSDLRLFAGMLAIQVGTNLGQDLMKNVEGSG